MATKTLPKEFLDMLADLGLQKLGETLAESEPSVSIRLNRSKGIGQRDVDMTGKPVEWCPDGIRLDQRPKFTFDPMFHQGCYYVQEASSMFHSHIIGELTGGCDTPLRVLDACAAPGGKTTAIIDALPKGSLVVANEYVPARAAVLRENIIKWGYPATVVTRGDTSSFRRLKESFDIIVADVPCSGEGMMRKDDDAVAQWSPGLVRDCAERQWEIVSNLWQALRPGGYLIYSTCTFNRIENECMIEKIINEFEAESVGIKINPEWGICGGIDTDAYCYRFLPDHLQGEGLFAAVIRKPGHMSMDKMAKKSSGKTDRRNKNKKSEATDKVKSWLRNDSENSVDIYNEEDRINLFPKEYLSFLNLLKKETEVIHEGVLVGTIKGHDVIPSQSLALSNYLSDEFPRHEIGMEEALAFLSGETITLPEGTKRGYILLTYRGRPLGFVKNIGNRSNNLYPAPWRIKSKYK